MNPTEKATLWETLTSYQRRNAESVRPPSERIDPDIPGSHFWVILVMNWQNLHPLIQDVLYEWYYTITRKQNNHVEELDPQSTEALVKRLEVLDDKLRSFDLERTNLEQELSVRDRDFRTLRKISGKKEKENIEIQQMLGRSFEEKIMQKQDELDENEETIRELEGKIKQLEGNQVSTNVTSRSDSNQLAPIVISENLNQDEVIKEMKYHIDERTRLLKEVGEKLKELNTTVNQQKSTIANLRKEILTKDEKIKEIKGLLNL
ncbi:MAG: hypothetical protein HZR80_20760 [Candidatus Heimdallarchaeota archaeon]